MGLKSLVLITLVAGFMLVNATNVPDLDLRDLVTFILIQMEKTKADADALLNTQKAKADLAGYTVLRGIVIGSSGQAVSSTGTDFALKLTEMEMGAIASAFASDRFDSFTADGVAAEGVTYRMLAVPVDGKANAIANGQILHMQKVTLGVSAILMVKNE